MKRHTFLFNKLYCVSVLFSVFLLMFCSISQAADIDSILETKQERVLRLLKGELDIIKVEELTRVSVADPTIADVVKAEDNRVLIIGKSIGETAVFIWDIIGKRTVMVQVYQQDLVTIKNRVNSLLEIANINNLFLKANEDEDKVIISGYISEHKKRFLKKLLSHLKIKYLIL